MQLSGHTRRASRQSVLVPMALILLLVIATNQVCAFAPSSTFVVPRSTSTGITSNLCETSTSNRWRVISHLSLSPDNDGDDTFFLRASQEASRQRMQQLKDGEDPLAISLSTAIADAPATSNKDETDDVTNDAAALDEEVQKPQPSVSDDINIPIESQSLDIEESKEVKTSSYGALLESMSLIGEPVKEGAGGNEKTEEAVSAAPSPSLPLTEGLTAEEAEEIRKARETTSTISTPEEKEVSEDVIIAEGQTAEEAEAVRLSRLTAADDVAKTLKSSGGEGGDAADDTAPSETADKETKVPIDPFEARQEKTQPPKEANSQRSDQTNEPSVEPHPPAAAKPQTTTLSSDGKEIFEPTSSQLEINQENVDMGLLVLTSAMMALKSVVDKEKES